jgi:hypothetical protein
MTDRQGSIGCIILIVLLICYFLYDVDFSQDAKNTKEDWKHTNHEMFETFSLIRNFSCKQRNLGIVQNSVCEQNEKRIEYDSVEYYNADDAYTLLSTAFKLPDFFEKGYNPKSKELTKLKKQWEKNQKVNILSIHAILIIKAIVNSRKIKNSRDDKLSAF